MTTMTELLDAEAAVEAVWQAIPLQVARAIFVVGKAPIYGAYEPRPDSRFAIGETLLTYIEPVGYCWKAVEGGSMTFGVSLDFELLQPDGVILGGQRSFLSYSATSRNRVRELMLNVSLSLSGVAEGDYVLQYTLRCLNSAKLVAVELPFQVVEG